MVVVFAVVLEVVGVVFVAAALVCNGVVAAVVVDGVVAAPAVVLDGVVLEPATPMS